MPVKRRELTIPLLLLLLVVVLPPSVGASPANDDDVKTVETQVVSTLHGVIAAESFDVPTDTRVGDSITVLIHDDPSEQMQGVDGPATECESQDMLKYERVGSTSLSGNCVGAPFNC